jgi:MFS family permease
MMERTIDSPEPPLEPSAIHPQAWWRALHVRNFQKVWTVATSAHFGYWFSSIAFQWIVAQATGNNAVVLGFLYFVMLVPILLLSVPAGLLADRYDRRKIVVICQAGIVVISVTTAALIHWGPPPLPVLLLCGFAVGTAHSIATPSYTSLVANSVSRSDLPSAVPLQAIGMNLARILGPVAAGAIIYIGGTAESLLVYGLFGLLGLVVILRVPRLQQHAADTTATSIIRQIRSGFGHARGHPPAALALAIVAMCSLFAASYLAQLPVLAANSTDVTGAFVLLTSAGGIGSLIGVLLVAVRSWSSPSVTPAAVMLLVMGVVVAMLGYGPALGYEMVLIAIAGGLQFAIMTTCNRVIQQVVEDSHRGRVMSLYAIVWGGFLPLGGLWLGLLIGGVGLTWAFTINGVITVAFAIWALRPGARRTGVSAF